MQFLSFLTSVVLGSCAISKVFNKPSEDSLCLGQRQHGEASGTNGLNRG